MAAEYARCRSLFRPTADAAAGRVGDRV